jgi:hypothetical protein
MFTRESGKVTSVREPHPLNACIAFIVATASPIFNVVNFVHSVHILVVRLVTVSPIVSSSTFAFESGKKVSTNQDCVDRSGVSSVSFVIPVQPVKAVGSIEVTEAGISTDVMPVQPLYSLAAMLVVDEGITSAPVVHTEATLASRLSSRNKLGTSIHIELTNEFPGYSSYFPRKFSNRLSGSKKIKDRTVLTSS